MKLICSIISDLCVNVRLTDLDVILYLCSLIYQVKQDHVNNAKPPVYIGVPYFGLRCLKNCNFCCNIP